MKHRSLQFLPLFVVLALLTSFFTTATVHAADKQTFVLYTGRLQEDGNGNAPGSF